ncbi:hypothetical protein KC19_3G038600 [Ceratodon purpureus]|uniref:Uncharacterized protein n=1 Tax=Ceratodon purpureus TaxID=3225 RepID=A0A8T0II73_CERPU|nr:hypothetical protein KC19_3G038600 [Ceratodon purpureus]
MPSLFLFPDLLCLSLNCKATTPEIHQPLIKSFKISLNFYILVCLKALRAARTCLNVFGI